MEFCLRDPCPISPPSTTGLEKGWAHWWPSGVVPSRSKFISGAGAGHSSIHSLLAAVGVGVTRARRESAPVRGVWGPALSLMRVCLFSAWRCVPDRSDVNLWISGCNAETAGRQDMSRKPSLGKKHKFVSITGKPWEHCHPGRQGAGDLQSHLT